MALRRCLRALGGSESLKVIKALNDLWEPSRALKGLRRPFRAFYVSVCLDAYQTQRDMLFAYNIVCHIDVHL